MGWWNARWDDLEYETIAHIKSQPSTVAGVTGARTDYRCGCEATSHDQWILHLCDWHEGMDEGVAICKAHLDDDDEPMS